MPTITLVLAWGPGLPEGGPDHRYEMRVALDAQGALDRAAWQADPDPWPVRRAWPGEAERAGEVLLDPDAGWTLRFSRPDQPDADAPLHDVTRAPESLRPGAYLTIREPDGAEYGYRIVGVA